MPPSLQFHAPRRPPAGDTAAASPFKAKCFQIQDVSPQSHVTENRHSRFLVLKSLIYGQKTTSGFLETKIFREESRSGTPTPAGFEVMTGACSLFSPQTLSRDGAGRREHLSDGGEARAQKREA